MSNILHVCLYNTDPKAAKELTGHIGALNFVRLIGEVTTPLDLANALTGPGVDLIFFHLDPNPDAVLEVIEQVTNRHPEIALVAISQNTKPESILAPMRAGCEQFVCKPIDPADLASAVSRVTSKRLLTKRKSRCLAVVSASGGAGATSIACNLALEIGHLTDHQCALADLDLQFGDVALNFDLEPKYTSYDLAESLSGMDASILASSMAVLQCKVSVLARPDRVEQAEYVSPDVVHRVIELLTASHENVVLDVPRRLDTSSMAAFTQADHVLIVCQLLVPSIRNAKRLHDALRGCGIPAERLEIIVNRFDSGSGRINLKDIEELIKPVFATIPNDYQFVARSLDFGRPVAAIDGNNAIRKALRSMAKKFTVEPRQDQNQPNQGKKGLLTRLLG